MTVHIAPHIPPHITPELIIFDCDGTLTDSEAVHNRAVADVLADLGYPHYDFEYCMTHFAGRGMHNVVAAIEAQEGVTLPDHFVPSYVRLFLERMATQIEPVKGAPEAVAHLASRYKTCVASNGEPESVTQSVQAIGLYPLFGAERIFTKSQVARGKPYPDLFLFAAEKMGAAPESCVVVEDSLTGVQAGLAAGMHVIGLTAVAHHPEKTANDMKALGVPAIFSNWGEIVDYIKSIEGCG